MFNKNFFVISAILMVANSYAVDIKTIVGMVKLASNGMEDACLSMEFYEGAGCEGDDFPHSVTVPDNAGAPCSGKDGMSAKDYYCAADGFHSTAYSDSESCAGTAENMFLPNGKCTDGEGGKYSLKITCSLGAPCAGFEKEHVVA